MSRLFKVAREDVGGRGYGGRSQWHEEGKYEKRKERVVGLSKNRVDKVSQRATDRVTTTPVAKSPEKTIFVVEEELKGRVRIDSMAIAELM